MLMKGFEVGIPGVILLLLGAGFVISALVSYKTALKLGLIKDQSEAPKG